MSKPRTNYVALMNMVGKLRLADIEMLVALLSKPGFGVDAIEKATHVLRTEGRLHRLWKPQEPTARWGSKRQVFSLSTKAAVELGLPQPRKYDQRSRNLSSTKGYLVPHEWMISKLHAALLLLDWHGGVTFETWEQGEGVSTTYFSKKYLEDKPLRFSPDARFSLRVGERAHWFFLEADTGHEQIESTVAHKRTIAGKCRNYAILYANKIHQKLGMDTFNVLFLTPERKGRRPSFREQNMIAAARKYGGEIGQTTRFYRFVSVDDLDYRKPKRLLDEIVLTSRDEDRLPLVPVLA